MSSAPIQEVGRGSGCPSGFCRMLLGAAIIGAAVGWFVIGFCLVKFDLDVGRIADEVSAAQGVSGLARAQAALAGAGQELRYARGQMENDVLGAVLAAFCLVVLGSYLLRSGAKRACAAEGSCRPHPAEAGQSGREAGSTPTSGSPPGGPTVV